MSPFAGVSLVALLVGPCQSGGEASSPPTGGSDTSPPFVDVTKAAEPKSFIRPANVDELQALFDERFAQQQGAALATPSINPACAFEPIDLEKWGYAPFADDAPIRSRAGVLETTLTVDYAESSIAGCPVRLRNYNGKLRGPTLRVKPGDTLIVHLDNRLPPNEPPDVDDINIPHNFNSTNFHTHGFQVSPAGNSDNVLITIEPKHNFEFEIKIPTDHPPGTFWYHAHVHGSTALQVSSGMAGALIVEGGLDDVPEIAKAKDQIFVFQQIAYDEQGVIESYAKFGPGGWKTTKRHTTINGQIAPTITMRPGEVQRWRFIHGGVRETIMAKLQGHELLEIAVDGLALGTIDRWDAVELEPGYRSDVLVKAASLQKGEKRVEFYLVDAESSPAQSLLGVREEERILAKIVIEGKPLDMKLPDEAELRGLRPHADIPDVELDGEPQHVEFDIAQARCDPDKPLEPCQPCQPGTDGCKLRFMVNQRPFNGQNIRRLVLGTASKWTVSATSIAAHPFHIHVNPFQHTRKGPKGEDEIIWRDTLLITKGTSVELRSRYERYIGSFVLHCHILDHEDQGMMQLVEISNGAAGHGH